VWENWKIKTNNKESRQIFEKKCEYNEAVYQLLIDFKKPQIHVGENSVKYSD
jgi:hypothetical protein